MPTKPALPPLGYIPSAVQGSQPGRALEGARSLPIGLIDPNPAQARQVFDPTALQELADSIAAHGVLEPILVRPVGTRYQIVAGERRVRAARLAGLDSIPAIIKEMTDEQAGYTTAIENLQREDLDPADEARWLQYLLDTTPGLSQRKLADQLGKSHEWVSGRIRRLSTKLTELPQGSVNEPEQSREGWAIDPPMDSPNEPEQRPAPAARVSRAELDSAPPVPVKWKQFHEWLTARSIPPPVAPSVRALLREQIDEVIKGLQAWRADLEED